MSHVCSQSVVIGMGAPAGRLKQDCSDPAFRSIPYHYYSHDRLECDVYESMLNEGHDFGGEKEKVFQRWEQLFHFEFIDSFSV